MAEINTYSLLLHDDFMGEFIDDDREPQTYPSLDFANWGALALSEELVEEQKDLGGESANHPYEIYIVAPDGSRTRF